jgi:hypothetical protein
MLKCLRPRYCKYLLVNIAADQAAYLSFLPRRRHVLSTFVGSALNIDWWIWGIVYVSVLLSRKEVIHIGRLYC